MTGIPRPPRPPTQSRADQRDHADVVGRLGMVETLLRSVSDGMEDLKASYRNLRDKDGELEAGLKRIADEYKRQSEAATEAQLAQAKEFRAGLAAEAEARKADREAFTAALDRQTAASLAAVQQALFTTLGQKVVSWLVTAGGAGLLLVAGWFWSAHSGK